MSETAAATIGLALSGGGSRAIAFHLGCLRALNRLGLLDRVAVLSTVSGGSVIGAYLHAHGGDFASFERQIRALLAQGLAAPMVRKLFSPLGIKVAAAFVAAGTFALAIAAVKTAVKIIGLVTPQSLAAHVERFDIRSPLHRFASRTTLLEAALDDVLFKHMSLNDLPAKPHLVINTTELRTGSAFRFGTMESGSWRWGKLHRNEVSVAHAVAASAAYPLFLPAFDETLTFDKDGALSSARVLLTDGGIYDNLGLGCLWPDRSPDVSLNVIPIDTIICCSAGYGLRQEPPSQFLFARMLSVFSAIFDRAQNASIHRLHEAQRTGQIKSFIFSYLGQLDQKLPSPPANLVRREDAHAYPTDFNAMPHDWVERLSLRGEQLTLCLARAYIPHLVKERFSDSKTKMSSRHDGGCIYCGSQGPFSDEHVVSAGLGGDDKAWLLSGCVCRVCNTDIFSKLETRFLRASPLAMARLFLQPRTRNKGSKTGMPSVQPKVSFVRLPDSNILLEGELDAGGQSKMLPQLVVADAQQVTITGPDAKSIADFLSQLRAAMTDEVSIIEKRRDGLEVTCDVTALMWKDGAYKLGDTTTNAQPPTAGLWVEPLVRPATVSEGDILLPRVFRQLAGQLVCRVDDASKAAIFMTALRNAPELMDVSRIDTAATATAQPGFHQRYNFDIAAYDRVLTKVGLNLVAKLLGVTLIRNPSFDAAVAYARDGIGEVCKYPPERTVEFANLLGTPLPDRHVFALMSGPGPNGSHCLLVLTRLYGGPMEGIRVAEFQTPIPGLETPIVVHVDYVNHKIEQLTLEQHVERIVMAGGNAPA